eukprot:TRINITY_DN92651_c0_g1_i1.p1 TRINITY_DN92651_c0_g1~~TRINITY_DN92651_c0_g1_i1.p1  ORF type:complete len:372 (+),score=47.34 TRINITY_DN92651_c0_g1_i1:35-1150(+)
MLPGRCWLALTLTASAFAAEEVLHVTAYWAKVHKQCVGHGLEHAAQWVRQTLTGELPDVFALAEMQGATVAPPHPYKSVGAACNGLKEEPPHLMGIFYDAERWSLEKVFPASAGEGPCNLTTLTAQMAAGQPLCKLPAPSTLAARSGNGYLSHDWGACCGCVDHPSLSPSGSSKGQGQRPFAAVRLRQRSQGNAELCVVAASLPHPYPRGCDRNEWQCRMNDPGTGLFGTDNLLAQVGALCGTARILLLADTNLDSPLSSLRDLFPAGPLSEMVEDVNRTFTCCYDGPGSRDINRFASDRIGARGALSARTVGGSRSAGPMRLSDIPFNDTCATGLGRNAYGFICCGSREEHSPLMSRIAIPLNREVVLFG